MNWDLLEHSGYGPDWVWHEILETDPYLLAGRNLHTILDVGANYGFFSIRAAELFPGARIRAFEPDPECLAWAAENIRRSGYDIDLRPEAVAGHSGTVDFVTGLDVHGHVAFSGEPSTPVPCVTLTEAISGLGAVDLAKIDIEGGEYAIVTETPAETWGRIGSVAMELHQFEHFDVPAAVARLEEFYTVVLDGIMLYAHH